MSRPADGSVPNVTCREMARFFRGRADHYPWSDKYMREVHDSPSKSGRTEREHMVSWFGSNPGKGSGAYSRKSGNDDARTCYNRLQNAASLLWIAEAVGVDEKVAESAFLAAAASGDRRSACAAVRRAIPWEQIRKLYLESREDRYGGLWGDLLHGLRRRER